MGLFSVRIGLGADGENEIENKMAFVTFAIVGDGNGRVVAEDCHPIGERIPINIGETGADEGDG